MPSKKQYKAKYPVIMLIDDSEIDNFINQKMIEGCSFAENIYVHTSSKSGLELLRNIQKMESLHADLIPRIIFLDINMPIMDGFQFAAEFEKFPETFRKNTKIVVLTTSVSPTDIVKSKQYKVHRYVNKPLTQEILASL